MIAKLKGTVDEISEDSLIIDVGGIGYEVFVTAELRNRAVIGQQIEAQIYHAFRQDEQFLCGFVDAQELSVFKALLIVPGIGIKSALAILSSLTIEDIAIAIAQQNADALCRAKGIGRKNAERILLELKDRNEVKLADSDKLLSNSVENEAMLALLSLGYKKGNISKALQQVKEQNEKDLDLNTLVVECLRIL